MKSDLKEQRFKDVTIGAIETMVHLIDWRKIQHEVSKKIGYAVEVRYYNGLIPDIKATFQKYYEQEKRSILIDNECCAITSKPLNIYTTEQLEEVDNNYGQKAVKLITSKFLEIGFHKCDTIEEDGTKISYSGASFYINIDMDDIKSSLTGEKIPLYKYMQGRYNYNPRIKNNEMNILKLVYETSSNKDWKKEQNIDVNI